MKKLLMSVIGIIFSLTANAQGNFIPKKQTFVHESSKKYEWPTDPLVLEKLNDWQDLKFGIMFHWGVYSVPGIAESWALCSEDRWFTDRRHEARPDLNSYCEFKKWSWGLSKSLILNIQIIPLQKDLTKMASIVMLPIMYSMHFANRDL